jgi:signal transduction histidine kinase
MEDRPVSVLLVEDDEDDYLLTKAMFDDLPPGAYHLDRVPDYESALQAFDECDHDVYLVDYRLGKRTGIELIAAAIAHGCTRPMIMLTGQREREIDLQAMQTGAADYLVKDELVVALLERAIRYALQKQRYDDALRQANQQLEERVAARTAELERLNAALQAEITERARAEEALRQADRRKDEFLATLAHELRIPLTPLVSALQLIEIQPNYADQVQRLRQIMSRQTEQLVRLIEDLLDVSRISRGKLNLRRQNVRLKDVIEIALDLSRPVIEAANHRLELQLPFDSPVLYGDKVRLAQVISNLLINAAKYTPAEGLIELSVEADCERVVICIRDSGIGIPPEMLPRVFEMFTQVDSSTTRSHGGLGIGLTIAKTLVEMHQGTLTADSPGMNRGSTFAISLPILAADNALAEAGSSATSTIVLPPAASILIVDDNQPAGYLLSRLLQKLGQQVHTVRCAADALREIPKRVPDIVISDIAMPGMSGYELAQQIRALPNLPQPVLIAVTGYGQESDRQRAHAAGFDYHLTKPVGLPDLQQLLASLPPRPALHRQIPIS